MKLSKKLGGTGEQRGVSKKKGGPPQKRERKKFGRGKGRTDKVASKGEMGGLEEILTHWRKPCRKKMQGEKNCLPVTIFSWWKGGGG